MKIRIEHIALWTRNLEEMKTFYMKFFDAVPNKKYSNLSKSLETYFLTFPGGSPRLELMQRPEVMANAQPYAEGYAHIAFALGNRATVDRLTDVLQEAGYKKLDGPRTTGDGYYEATFHDPDGNVIELTV